jgi:hypothetical protein
MMGMSNGENKKSFWTSLPGILTGIAAIISAIVGIVAAVPIINPSPQPDSIDNTKPVAIAASNPRIANEGDIVTLDGSRSRDKEGISIYEWEQIGGEPFNFDTKIANPTFRAPDVSQDTELKFRLIVRDDNNNISEPAFVTVTVKNVSQSSISGDTIIAPDQRNNDVTTTNTPPSPPSPPSSTAPINDSAPAITTPPNTNEQVTLAHETNFIPETLRNPGLKLFTHTVKVMVNAPPRILSLIENVTYYPTQQGLTSFNHPQIRYSPGDNFAFSFNALEDFGLKAKVYFKDGKVQDLSTSISFP